MDSTKRLRNTAQRSLVLDVVKNRMDHPIADDIYDEARERDPRISRGTVYRNLNILAELGEIKRLSMPGGPDHFDLRTDDHYHFYCRGCNRVIDMELPYKVELDHMDPGLAGYKTEGHRLVLIGVCPDCQK